MVPTPEQDEIYTVLNKCSEAQDEDGSVYPGMSYEDGVAAAINWLTDDGENPFD